MSIEIGGVEVLSLEEVSKRLNVAPEALKRCMRRGELVARKIGDQWFVTSQNLLAFLQTPAPKRSKAAKDETKGTDSKPPAVVEDRPGQEPTAPFAAIPIEELVAPRPAQVSRPETVLPHELPPGAGTPAVAESPAAAPTSPVRQISDPFAVPGGLPISQRPTEPFLEAIKDPPPPSELATEITMPAVPFPPKEDPEPPPQHPTEELSVEAITPAPKPDAREGEKPGEALAALFEMPLLPPEQPVLTSLAPAPVDSGPPSPPPGESKEDRHAMAIAATQRRAMAKGVVAEPPAAPGSTEPRKSLLDSEELPVPVIDSPGASHAPDTRAIAKTAVPPLPPGGGYLSEVPGMFGPNSATVLLTPDQVKADAERVKKHLFDVVEQGRVAQRARDEIVATVRQLPLEEQSFALAGPVGEQLVKLDKLIEDGVRAQKELGLPAAPPAPNVVTAVHKSPPQEESKWVPLGEPEKQEPMPLIAPAAPEGKKAPSRVAPAGVGGETWHEVGLPAPSGSTPSNGRDGNGPIVRLTLALSDEEKRVLSDHRIAEEVAVQEIMRRYQPTDERGWSDAKGRYFQPLRAKSVSK